MTPETGEQGVTAGAKFTVPFDPVPIEGKSAFSAIRHRDGLFSGQFHIISTNFPTPGFVIRLHGSVTCFTLIGNAAFLNGVVEQSNAPEFNPEGSTISWSVVDQGESVHDVPDLHSVFFPAFAPCDPASSPPADFPVVQGEVQVHK